MWTKSLGSREDRSWYLYQSDEAGRSERAPRADDEGEAKSNGIGRWRIAWIVLVLNCRFRSSNTAAQAVELGRVTVAGQSGSELRGERVGIMPTKDGEGDDGQ